MVSDYTWVDINHWQRYEKSSAEQKNPVLFLLCNGIMIIFSFLERGEIDEFIHFEEKKRRMVAHEIISYWPTEA